MEEGGLQLLGAERAADARAVPGIGMFPDTDGYDCAPDDVVPLPDDVAYVTNDWEEPELYLREEGQITVFWRACVGRWREEVARWPQRQRQGL
jgi:hypothetical protein